MNIDLRLGNCIDVMATLPENSIDTIITDPPYHLTSIVKRFGGKNAAPAKFGTDGVFARASKGFMGKTWDGGSVAFEVETWEQAYRVLKPGGFLLAFGGTRTYHRLACAIEDAGFEIRDTIAWVYGSGFPKSYDISKGIDKQAGAEREVVGKSDSHGLALKPGKPTYVGGFLGKRPDAPDITAPATPAAQLWHGWGTALKPAMELICVAMKPIDGTFVNNALTWGVAGLWIDGGRVPTNGEEVTINTWNDGSKPFGGGAGHDYSGRTETDGRFPANFVHDGSDEVVGLFPNDAQRFFYCAKSSRSERNAGLDCYLTVKYNNDKSNNGGLSWEDVSTAAVQLLKKVTSESTVTWNIGESGESITGQCLSDSLYTTLTEINRIIELKTLRLLTLSLTSDYTAGANCEAGNGGSHAESVASLRMWILTTTNGQLELARGVSDAALQMLLKAKSADAWSQATNIHATVKPLALMRYLARLTKTPTGGVVLDPFMGSGTTGVACVKEGRSFIGIELDEGYLEIAKKRIEHAQTECAQLSIDDLAEE